MSEAIAPQRESRVKKTLTNAKVGLSFYLLALILSFFSRKLFLNCLGTDFIGLTSTLQNLLGFLNLAELGVGTAIAVVLYKPLFDNNHDSISEIVSVLGYLYQKIGLVILSAGIILSCFLPILFPASESGFSYGVVYFAYYSYFTSSLLGYFINYKQNLLYADQRTYVITGYLRTIEIIRTLIQIAIAYYTRNVFLWIAMEVILGLTYSIILNWRIKKTYPWLDCQIKRGKQNLKKYPQIGKSIKQLFVHKIAAFAEYQSMPVLIYSLVSLPMVAIYANYTLIIDKISGIINSIFSGFDASIGNLIAEGNTDKTINIFYEIKALRHYIATIVSFILYCSISPFIGWWLGDQFVMPDYIVYILIAYTYLRISDGYTGSFLFGYGLFKDIWAPIAEVIIVFGVASIAGLKFGLAGVMMGPFVSFFLIFCIWKPIFLFKNGFKCSSKHYWLNTVVYLIISAISIAAAILCTNYFKPYFSLDNIFHLCIYSAISLITIVLFETALMWLLGKGFRPLCLRLIHR